MRGTGLRVARAVQVRRGAPLAAFFAATLLLLLAPPAHAQTTNYTITITVPNVTITTRNIWVVTARYVNESAVQVVVSCLASGQCPVLTLLVGYNGTIYYNATISISSCSGECTRVVTVPVSSHTVWIYWSYDGFSANITVVYAPYPSPVIKYIMVAVAAGVAMSLAVRSSQKLAGIGLLAASIVVYAMAAHGVLPSEAIVISMLMVIGGVILLAFK